MHLPVRLCGQTAWRHSASPSTQSKEATAKERKAAETKIKEARAEAIRKKAQVVEAAPAAEPTAEGAESQEAQA